MRTSETTGLTRDERDIARRWCILNAWGWPSDLPQPPASECFTAARVAMRKAERAIGLTKCLAYWNSDEFHAMQIRPAYTS